jgi:hypothetical protein
MSYPSLELQTALVLALRNNIGAAVGARVYDEVPTPIPPATTAQFPYVTLGAMQTLPAKADCIDGVEAFPIVDIWSRKVGFTEAKTIAKAILAALDDQPVYVTGYQVTVFEVQSITELRDPDGITRHISITFHTLIEPS